MKDLDDEIAEVIATFILGIVVIIIFACFFSCNPQRAWNSKGLKNHWIDTATTYQRDTIHIASHEKDSLIHYSKLDTIVIHDKYFTEKILLDTLHHTIYEHTILNSRDTVFTKEIHTVHYAPVPEKQITMWKAVTHVWPLIAVLLVIIILQQILKR